MKFVAAPKPAAPLSAQNVFGAQVSLWAPVLITWTAEAAAVVSAPLIRNRKKAFGSPSKLSVSVPVIAAAPPVQ